MAADKPSARKLIFACVLILGFLSFLCHASSMDVVGGDGSLENRKVGEEEEDDDDDGKVSVSLYYESLCPYCANFIVNQLVKLFETDLISVVNLRLVPWGNTQISPNTSWVCQHGPDECFLNMVEACSISAWPDPEVHFRFIYCVERLHLENRHNEWQSCFDALGLSSTPVRDCFNNQLEVRLELQYADETAQLNPPHTYVPWVLVNHQPLLEDYGNVVAYICRSYRGQNIPQACRTTSYLIESSNEKNQNLKTNVCLASEAVNSTSSDQKSRG